MNLVTISQETPSVVTLSEAKTWLRVDNTDEDTRVEILMAAAVEYVAQTSRMVLSPSVFQYVLDKFPAVNWYQYYPVMAPFPQLLTQGKNFFLPNQTIQEPIYPVTAIDFIQYIDAATGETVTLDPADYVVDIHQGRLAPATNKTWPFTQNTLNAVTIQFQAGFTAETVPSTIKLAILNHCLLAYFNPGGIPAADIENLNKAIIGCREVLLV